jgi:hypothetical protein
MNYINRRGTRQFLKSVMLATPEDEMVGTMLFAILTDVTVAMGQWSARHLAFIVEMFL